MSYRYDIELHSELLKVGRKLERKETHQLEEPFVDSILSTLEFFGADRSQLYQANWDLKAAKYKIFDWLGMCYTGRMDADEDSSVFKCLEKMVKLYNFQNHVGGFAWWLRGHDMEIEDPSRCVDCIDSYDSWHKQSPAERMKEQNEREKFFGGVIDV